MSDDRFFTRREVGAAVTFLALTAGIGVGAYRAGLGMAGTHAGAVVVPAEASPLPQGEALYASSCAGCHGAAAEGGLGPNLTATTTWPLKTFSQAVLDGEAPGGRPLGAVMPRFRQTGLSGAPATDEQIRLIHEYVKGL